MKRGEQHDEIGRLRNGVIRNGGIMLIQSALPSLARPRREGKRRETCRDTLA